MTSIRIGDRAKWGIKGKLEPCPYCDGVNFHKKGCQKPPDEVAGNQEENAQEPAGNPGGAA